MPNSTDARHKADTSTEICSRYVASPSHDDVDLVVNDHADIDGILSLFALLHPEPATRNHTALVGAASMGDFLAWADRPAFELAQHLSLMLFGDGTRPVDVGDVYSLAFQIASDVLDGTVARSAPVADGWAVLEQGCDRLERGEVSVEKVGDRLVSFVYPAAAGQRLGAALEIPALNAIVDDTVWLWPQVRNRDHGEWVQLVSVPHGGQWFHDVWVPSYCWAETPHRTPLPGLVSTGDSNRWSIEHPPLADAITRLGETETASGSWVSADELTPFRTLAGRRFPVVASFVDADGRPAPSDLAPDRVAAALATVW